MTKSFGVLFLGDFTETNYWTNETTISQYFIFDVKKIVIALVGPYITL